MTVKFWNTSIKLYKSI